MNWKDSLYGIYMKSYRQAFTKSEVSRLLCEMKEDRLFSIESALAESKRAQAKVAGAKQQLEQKKSAHEFTLRAESYIMETRSRTIIAQTCLDMARIELAFIDHLLVDLPVSVVQWQAVQEYETAYELVWAIVTGGGTPDVMRTAACHTKSRIISRTVGELACEDNTLRLPDKSQVDKAFQEAIEKLDGHFDVSVALSLPDFEDVFVEFTCQQAKLLEDYGRLPFIQEEVARVEKF